MDLVILRAVELSWAYGEGLWCLLVAVERLPLPPKGEAEGQPRTSCDCGSELRPLQFPAAQTVVSDVITCLSLLCRPCRLHVVLLNNL